MAVLFLIASIQVPGANDTFRRVTSLFGRGTRRQPIEDLFNSTRWLSVEDKVSDDPFIASCREPLVVPDDKEGFVYLLRFWWEYDRDGSMRLPNETESRIIAARSKHMRQVLNGRDSPLLLGELSSNGLHQWTVVAKERLGATLDVFDSMPTSSQLESETCVAMGSSCSLDESWAEVTQLHKIIRAFHEPK